MIEIYLESLADEKSFS